MQTGLKKILFAAMMVAVMGIATRAMAGGAVDPDLTGANFKVTPNLGNIAGGETVEISGGANFATDGLAATKVFFGGVQSPSISIISDSVISAVVPAHARGAVSVQVTNSAGTTATDTKATAFTYTTPNRVLQVSVIMTIGQNINISWGAGTDKDDLVNLPKSGAAHAAGDITPYTWYVRDSEFSLPGAVSGPATDAKVNLNATYSTDVNGYVFGADADNGHNLLVQVTSLTNSGCIITGISSDSTPLPLGVGQTFWTNAAAAPAAADRYEMQANLTKAAKITGVTNAGNVVSVTTSAAHGFANGNTVTIVSATADKTYDGSFVISNVAANSFDYTDTQAPSGATITGSAFKNLAANNKIVNNGISAAPITLFSAANAAAMPPGYLVLQLAVTTPPSTLDVNNPPLEQVVTVSLVATPQ
jgi:hypothetical protein